ncbi:hypothetical protein [Inquilinus sp. CA228]|uniref:hypothetical protein n=1 Tax=Inquilinus sp. CA228 TaxID=3455609 RepID=UPI003F8D2B51
MLTRTGGGNDMVSYADSTEGVIANPLFGQGFGGDAEGDTYLGVENVEGSGWDDWLIGDDGVNRLDGSAGRGRLYGEGDDIFEGAGRGG